MYLLPKSYQNKYFEDTTYFAKAPRVSLDNLHDILCHFKFKQYAYILVRNATLLQQKYHCVENAHTLWNNLIHQSKLRNKTSK